MLPIQVQAHLLKVLCLLAILSRNELVSSVRHRQIKVSYELLKDFVLQRKISAQRELPKEKGKKRDDDPDASSALMDVDHLLDFTPVQHKGTFREGMKKYIDVTDILRLIV